MGKTIIKKRYMNSDENYANLVVWRCLGIIHVGGSYTSPGQFEYFTSIVDNIVEKYLPLKRMKTDSSD